MVKVLREKNHHLVTRDGFPVYIFLSFLPKMLNKNLTDLAKLKLLMENLKMKINRSKFLFLFLHRIASFETWKRVALLRYLRNMKFL